MSRGVCAVLGIHFELFCRQIGPMKATRWFSVGRLSIAAWFVTYYGSWMHRAILRSGHEPPEPNQIFGPMFGYFWILAIVAAVVAIKLPEEEEEDRVFRETNDCVALVIALFCIWVSALPELTMG